MLFPRRLSLRAVPVALCSALTFVACDGTGPEGNTFVGTSGTNRSDPSGSGGSDRPASLTGTAVAALTLSSCDPAGYSIPLSIAGSAPFDVTLDTGSTSIGVASSSCRGCDVTPKFSPTGGVTDVGIQTKSQYVTGQWSGEVYEGEVSLAPATRASVKFVGIEQQNDFFVDQSCGSKSGGVQGIMGFGPAVGAVKGTTGFFDQFIAETNAPNVFATKLCDQGGTLWLGGYDANETTAPPKFTPLLDTMNTAYAVHLANVGIQGTNIPVATPDYETTIVDTGSSVFLLEKSAFTPLTKAIAASDGFKDLIGEDASWFDNPDGQNCKRLTATKTDLDAVLPPISLTFGADDEAITIEASATESYLGNYEGYWCSTLVTFTPADDFPIASVMGAPMLRSNVVIYDRQNQRIGFAPHTPCK
jgi:hypothetical protein